MFNFQAILTAAATGALAGWALKVGPAKGAAVGAIVAVAGPMVGGIVGGILPKPTAPAGTAPTAP